MDKDELFRRVARHFKGKGIGVEDSGGDARLVMTPARALETLDPAILDLETESLRRVRVKVADVLRELSAAGHDEELALEFIGHKEGQRLFFFNQTEEIWPLVIKPAEIPSEILERVFPPFGEDKKNKAEKLREKASLLLAEAAELES